jgi:hypothetical protein
METLTRRLRGLLGVGVTWGTLWAGIGAVIGLVVGEPMAVWALGMGLYGLVSGVGFGALLSLGEGRKTLLDLRLGRVAVWGVLGSALVPLLFGAMGTFGVGTTLADVLGAVLTTAVLGGTFAPGSVAIARRAQLRQAEERKLLEE